jgi:L-2-hydroxyglutarate oxidase
LRKFDVAIIGGGIIGLATAFKLLESRSNLKLCILEKESCIAQHQTGNNSGVIHSGIYYKPRSLKALNCIKGYNQLLEFCNKEEIPYNLCGKVIVACDEKEEYRLNNLYKRGLENGLDKLRLIGRSELNEIEPYADGLKAIHVPYTGIIDFEIVSEKLAEKIEQRDGSICFNEKVFKIIPNSFNEIITTVNSFKAKVIINCGGLYSDVLTQLTYKNRIPFRIIPFKGEYYKLKKERCNLINSLIYPVPDPTFPFLGVHFTKKINGDVEAGPNAILAFKKEGYNKNDFDLEDVFSTLSWPGFYYITSKYWKTGYEEFYRSYSKKAFVKALKKLIPIVEENDLAEGGAGVRAQACSREGKLIDDFLILKENNIINVCNAPSPAATSSLAIGEYIAEIATGLN